MKNDIHQTNCREADVRISVLVARIDCVETELSNAERHQLVARFFDTPNRQNPKPAKHEGETGKRQRKKPTY
jgi:hypothetical protein